MIRSRKFAQELLVLGLSLTFFGCGKNENPSPKTPPEKPKFQFQSKINSLPCQNSFRLNPAGEARTAQAFLQIQETLELDRAEIYVELQDQEGRSLRNSAARISANPISREFGAVIVCSSAMPSDDSTKWGMANLPKSFFLQENYIPGEIGIIFPTVGEEMNWTHPAYVQGFTPIEPRAMLWFEKISQEGQVEISQTDNFYEIMFSQKFSPMTEGKSWFQFVLAHYKIVKPLAAK
ncbi:MAG: hypothetical protein K2X47_09670 [Bdellovibrionales bacterium]|nr:hypothetical protein [Bdellovibrionales bacterium]